MIYHIFINEKKLSAQAEAAISEYSKRLSPFCKLRISTAKDRPLKSDNQKTTASGLPVSLFLCPDNSGTQTVSSEAFAELLTKQVESGCSEFQYFIGFPIPDELPVPHVFSISGMSLSNEIAAIALAEQIYRGYTINHHIPYHK